MAREAFESALVENPDDVSLYRIYADWLLEHDDPRGEFIQVQLALEDPNLSDEKREQLQQREQALLDEHVATWLGSLAEPLLGRDDIEFRFGRGWLDSLRLPTVREGLSRVLAAAPELRLLRRLVIAKGPNEMDPLDREQAFRMHVLAGVAWYEDEEEVALDPLAECPYLGNLRVLQLGDVDYERADFSPRVLPEMLAQMPRLEELRLFLWTLEAEQLFALNLSNLRLLQVAGVFNYPLEILANNESLGNLTHLLIEPVAPGGHQKIFSDTTGALLRSPSLTSLKQLQLRFLVPGDAFCQELVESGILRRLKALDIQYSEITDEGAATLAACPDLRGLEVLDVSRNYLTEAGIEPLRATGIQLIDQPQTQPPEEGGEGRYDPISE